MAGGKNISLPVLLTLLFTLPVSFAPGTPAFAQAGSTGGTIGKTDKSISGAERDAEPNRAVKPRAKAETPTRSNVFENPTINGIRVDRCMKWGPVGCGNPAANYWCRSKGFQRAASWSGTEIRPTIFQDPQSSVKVCDYFFCGGFTRIVCE